MHAVAFNAGRKLLADCAFGGVGGIGGAHGVAPLPDRVGGFEHHDHYRSFGHELYERPIKRPFLVDRVKRFGLELAEPLHFHSDDAEAGFLNDGDDLASLPRGDRVGLDDRECSFHVVCSNYAFDLFADLSRGGAYGDTRGFHGGDLVLGLAAPPGNDRARMAHAAARRRGLPGDEADHRLLDVILYVRGGLFLGIAADLADHDDGVRVGIFVEQPQGLGVCGADDGVTADADAGGLPDTKRAQLSHGFISQRSRTGDDSDVPLLVNMARHDADLALAGRNDAGTIRADQPRARMILQIRPSTHHVRRRDAFGDADHQRATGVSGFHDRVRGERRRNEDNARVRPGSL